MKRRERRAKHDSNVCFSFRSSHTDSAGIRIGRLYYFMLYEKAFWHSIYAISLRDLVSLYHISDFQNRDDTAAVDSVCPGAYSICGQYPRLTAVRSPSSRKLRTIPLAGQTSLQPSFQG
jgi:hypothetical protein